MMNFLNKNVKGWTPTEEQYLAAIETGYQVMKHTGNVQQAGQAITDELNTLHRMSQNKSGMMEATGDKRFDAMMGQIQREPAIPDSQMPPTDVKDLYAWAVKNNKPYHKIFAEWANREGYF